METLGFIISLAIAHPFTMIVFPVGITVTLAVCEYVENIRPRKKRRA